VPLEPIKKRGRRPLPLGRTFFSDLPAILGISRATAWRRYRPTSDPLAYAEWATRLDIRVRSDDTLHCCSAAVEALRDLLAAQEMDSARHLSNAGKATRLKYARKAPKAGDNPAADPLPVNPVTAADGWRSGPGEGSARVTATIALSGN
jgi:hypothetical protein